MPAQKSGSTPHRIHLAAGVLVAIAAAALFGAGCSDGGSTAEVSCRDGIKNGSESDVDCGGAECKPCADGQGCIEGNSCSSGVCTNGTCRPATCSDGVQNGDEISVDCGGPCTKAETCNGLDDDCNGKIDDGIASVTCGLGACQKTIPGCPEVPCTPDTPGVEACDGLLDEDCDGVVDNGCTCVDGQTQSCYTGAPETLNVGTCKAGSQSCKAGSWGSCENDVTPKTETCNGLDDDCNGSVDDNIEQVTCGIGACMVVQSGCDNGQPAPCVPNQPTPESCNGLDDDCNGAVDDGLGSIMCGVGACANSVPACANGMPATCVPGQPMVELCNGLDDDCNGLVDDGLGSIMCGIGACMNSVPACANGMPGICTPGQPTAEVCNGLDDDCNGAMDDGLGSNTCGVGACFTTVPACMNGMPVMCTPGSPMTESCNGFDDDCDGVADQNNPGGGQVCNTGKSGICAAGTTACSSGMIVCNQNNQPAPTEDCGTPVDDNCNGQINEACGVCTPNSTRSCYSGPVGTAGVGACKSGTQTCNAAGSAWGPCIGEVLPATETCKNNLDDDCDAQVNEGCSALSCQNFYVEDFNDGSATNLSGVYQVNWCNSYVATAANTPACMVPGQTTRTNATGGTNTFVGFWVNKATASCSAVQLSYDWYQFANAGAVVEYKQTTDTFSSYSTCSSTVGWTTAVPSSSMSTLQTCSSIVNINIPFGSSPAVYIKFKSTNAQNNAMWWDNIKLTLLGCDC